jgi:hypothetical protein
MCIPLMRNKAKILVVEEQTSMAIMMAYLLSSPGCRPLTLTTSKD